MRKPLAVAILGAALICLQTAAVAAPEAEAGSIAYCAAKWNSLVAANATAGQTQAAFMDKCTSCRAKWDAMVAANATGGMSRDEYLKKCSKGIAWLFPGFALLGAGAVGIIAAGGGGHPPVSP
jgi:hypothetical protein